MIAILLSSFSAQAVDYQIAAFATQIEATDYQTSVGPLGSSVYCSAYLVQDEQEPSFPYEVWTPEILGTRKWASPSGGILTWVSNNRISIAPGQWRDKCDQEYIYLDSAIAFVDLSASGANGLDTGAEAANTWYSVWVVRSTSNPLDVIGLLSLSQTAPALPTGYSIQRRIGWVRNDGSSNILPFFQTQVGTARRTEYDVAAASLAVLTGGTATVFTDVDFSNFMPPTADVVILDAENTGTQTADVRTDLAVNQRGQRIKTLTEMRFDLIPDSTEDGEYRVGGAGGALTLYVAGYYETP